MKRDTAMKLDKGTVSFSLGKQTAGSTNFAVQTPNGSMDTHGSVGTVTVSPPWVKVAAVTGSVTFTPTGGRTPITVKAGSTVIIRGVGADAEIFVIDTIGRTLTSFSMDGTQLSTRTATAQELDSTRGMIQDTIAFAALAVSHDLLSPADAAAVTATVTAINQSFAAVGLAAVETAAIGSSTAASSASGTSADSTPAAAGFSGGSANPANTSGPVISREQ